MLNPQRRKRPPRIQIDKGRVEYPIARFEEKLQALLLYYRKKQDRRGHWWRRKPDGSERTQKSKRLVFEENEKVQDQHRFGSTKDTEISIENTALVEK